MNKEKILGLLNNLTYLIKELDNEKKYLKWEIAFEKRYTPDYKDGRGLIIK